MTTTSRAASSALSVVAIVGGALCVVCVGLVGIAVLAALVIGSALQPAHSEEFEVSDPTCVELSATEALASVTITPINPSRVMSVQVDELDMRTGTLTGVATLPAGSSLATLTDAERLTFETDLDDAETWVDVEDGARVVVFRLQREPEFDVVIRGVRLWFAYGEPAGVQDLPLDVNWARDCSPS